MVGTFGNYSADIQRYTAMLATGFGTGTSSSGTTSSAQPALASSIYDISELMEQRITQKQELYKELSDTDYAMNLNTDARIALAHSAQEAIGNPDLLLQYQQQDTQLKQELARLQAEYQTTNQEYTALSNQYNPYGLAARSADSTMQYDSARVAAIQAELASLQTQRGELLQKTEESERDPQLLLQYHQQEIEIQQKFIALEEEQRALNALGGGTTIGSYNGGYNTGTYNTGGYNTGGYNTGNYGTTTPNYSSGEGLFDSYINRYRGMIIGLNSNTMQNTGSYGQTSSSSMMMQQQMMQQQAMQQQQQAMQQQMMMGMMMGMLGGSSDSSSSSSTNPMSQMMNMFSGMMGGSSSASTNPMSMMMGMMSGMMGGSSSASTNPMSSIMNMFSGMMGGTSSTAPKSSSTDSTLTQLMQKYLG